MKLMNSFGEQRAWNWFVSGASLLLVSLFPFPFLFVQPEEVLFPLLHAVDQLGPIQNRFGE